MPFFYNFSSAKVSDPFTTSGSASTELDVWFLKPGATRPCALQAVRLWGRGAALTSLSGISMALKVWPTTSSSGGTAVTPNPTDVRSPACVATAGAASAGVTSGTGTALYVGALGCSGSGPGGWTAQNPDAPVVLDGGQTKSIDGYSLSGTASMAYAFSGEFTE